MEQHYVYAVKNLKSLQLFCSRSKKSTSNNRPICFFGICCSSSLPFFILGNSNVAAPTYMQKNQVENQVEKCSLKGSSHLRWWGLSMRNVVCTWNEFLFLFILLMQTGLKKGEESSPFSVPKLPQSPCWNEARLVVVNCWTRNKETLWEKIEHFDK